MKTSLFSLPLISVLVLGALSLQGCEDKPKDNLRYGMLETDEIDLSSRLAARIKTVLVHAGDKVKAGQPLVEFEDDIMAAKKRRALAAISAAESQSHIAQNATRPEEIEQAKAAMSAAEKQKNFAKATVTRLKLVHAEGAISKQQLDEAQFKYESAEDAYEAAAAKYRLAQAGARKEQKTAAMALVEEAKTQLAEVNAYESDLKLVSPIDGEVQKVIAHEGELVAAGYAVVTLIRPDAPWATFHVPENELKTLTMGATIPVNIPAMDKKVTGKINFISPLGNFATLVTTKDRSSFDVRTFEVHAKLEGDLKNLRPGMTAVFSKP